MTIEEIRERAGIKKKLLIELAGITYPTLRRMDQNPERYTLEVLRATATILPESSKKLLREEVLSWLD